MKMYLRTVVYITAVVMGVSACEEEHVSSLPTFSGFRIEPLVWDSGDSVTITAVQSSLGDLLYKATYSWNVVCAKDTFTKKYEVVYDLDKSNPYIGFRLPDFFIGNQANISFTAEYNYTSASVSTTVSKGNSQSGLYGNIMTYPASQLQGIGKGTYTHTWERTSVLPSFAGFRIDRMVWNAGDSVTITAVQQSLGDLLYKAEYHWSVECTDTTFTKDYNVVYDADKSDPYIGIRLPDDFRSRMAKINFSVQYSYSATAPQSAPSGSNSGQSGIYGSITTTAASQLYGTGSGSYTLSW